MPEADPKRRIANGGALLAVRQGRSRDAQTTRLPHKPEPEETAPSLPRPAAKVEPPPRRRSAGDLVRAAIGWAIIGVLILAALVTVLLMPELMRRMGW